MFSKRRVKKRLHEKLHLGQKRWNKVSESLEHLLYPVKTGSIQVDELLVLLTSDHKDPGLNPA